MNILFVGSSADCHVDLWVKYFTKKHKVYLFSDKEDYLNDQEFDRIKIIKVESWTGKILNFLKIKKKLPYQFNKLTSVYGYAKKLNQTIYDLDIDIVHAHSLYYGYLTSFVKNDIPIVFPPMGSDVILHAQNSIIHRYLANKSYGRANVVTGDSILLQNKGYSVGAKKENNFIIQNGVDSSIFSPKSNNLKEKYGIKDDEILIFSPRAITPLYNIDVIIEAISKLIKSGYKVKCMLSFAFGDEYFLQLKNQVQGLRLINNIIWLGFLTYKDMSEHYNAADVVVSIPSSDSSPKSVYEAMFCRKPIVVSDLEWSYELLDKCNCIARVNIKDVEYLFKAIEKIITDSEYAQQLADNGLSAAHKYFDYKINMKEMELIMLNALNRKND